MVQKTDRIVQKEDRMGQKEDKKGLKKDRTYFIRVHKIILVTSLIIPTSTIP